LIGRVDKGALRAVPTALALDAKWWVRFRSAHPAKRDFVLTFSHTTERENVDGQEEADITGGR
jgi:hypothetical protein